MVHVSSKQNLRISWLVVISTLFSPNYLTEILKETISQRKRRSKSSGRWSLDLCFTSVTLIQTLFLVPVLFMPGNMELFSNSKNCWPAGVCRFQSSLVSGNLSKSLWVVDWLLIHSFAQCEICRCSSEDRSVFWKVLTELTVVLLSAVEFSELCLGGVL